MILRRKVLVLLLALDKASAHHEVLLLQLVHNVGHALGLSMRSFASAARLRLLSCLMCVGLRS